MLTKEEAKAPRSDDERALDDLSEMLTYCRPHKSRTERKFIRRFLLPLGVEHDKAGNLSKRIGTTPVAWSCHTDTVHDMAGRQEIRQVGDVIDLPAGTKSHCLGGDDTCGVWLMREMILKRVPGLYLFHRGEESGCVGSRFIAAKTPNVLTGIKAAIALDRKGTTDIITRQRGERCCSDEFAASVGALMDGLNLKPDPTGMYTDTASYTRLVAECTNLSVGYAKAHSIMEEINVRYLFELRERLFSFDHAKLEIKRDPSVEDVSTYSSYYSYGEDFRGPYGSHSKTMYGSAGWSWRNKPRTGYGRDEFGFDLYDQEPVTAADDIFDVVCALPNAVADWIEGHKMTVKEFVNSLYVGGYIDERDLNDIGWTAKK